MTADQQAAQDRAENEAVLRYYATARALAENWIQLLSITGVGPHAASIAASHVISMALASLANDDADAARNLVDELAAGLLKFSETLNEAAA